MKNKTLTILPILFYSGFASASLYVHQPVETQNNNESRLKIIFDEDEYQKDITNSSTNAKKEFLDNKNQSGKENFIAKKNNNDYKVSSKKDETSNEIYKNKGKESAKYSVKPVTTPEPETPKYKDVVLSSEHDIQPKIKTVYAKMDEGFLSNSMRKHLESLGWEMRWSSGSDRKITVPYIIEHKEGDVIEFVTQISELYGVFIDVYPNNKTINVSD